MKNSIRKNRPFSEKLSNFFRKIVGGPAEFLAYKADQIKETLKHKIVSRRLTSVELPENYTKMKKQLVYVFNHHVHEQYHKYGNLIHHIEFHGEVWKNILKEFADYEFNIEQKSKVFWEKVDIESHDKPVFLRGLAAKITFNKKDTEKPYIELYSTNGSLKIGKYTIVALDEINKVLTYVKNYEIGVEREEVVKV